MVTKAKQTSKQEEGKGRVKVGKLKLNRETVKELTASEEEQLKGGYGAEGGPAFSDATCPLTRRD